MAAGGIGLLLDPFVDAISGGGLESALPEVGGPAEIVAAGDRESFCFCESTSVPLDLLSGLFASLGWPVRPDASLSTR
jgi:hypothetical protein